MNGLKIKDVMEKMKKEVNKIGKSFLEYEIEPLQKGKLDVTCGLVLKNRTLTMRLAFLENKMGSKEEMTGYLILQNWRSLEYKKNHFENSDELLFLFSKLLKGELLKTIVTAEQLEINQWFVKRINEDCPLLEETERIAPEIILEILKEKTGTKTLTELDVTLCFYSIETIGEKSFLIESLKTSLPSFYLPYEELF